MNAPFADEYWKAAEKEIDTLEEMSAWDVDKHNYCMIVINETWAFECKLFPMVLLRSLKSSFVLMGIES